MPKLTNVTQPNRLSASQQKILTAVAKQPEVATVLPPQLQGRAAGRVVASLIAKALVREIRATAGLPAWRRDLDTGKAFALALTKQGKSVAAGLAVPITPRVEAVSNAGVATPFDVSQERPDLPGTSQESTGNGALCASASPIAEKLAASPRSASKIAGVVTLLSRDHGATLSDLIAATGWLPHTTRAALTGLRKRGLVIARESGPDRNSIYFIRSLDAARLA